MKVFPLTVVVSILFVFCKTTSIIEDGFTLEGHTSNIVDSTVIYLFQDNIAIDSTVIVNNEFTLKGKVKDVAERFVLRRLDTLDSKYIWLENGHIVLDATLGGLRNCSVSGSETQLLADSLNHLLATAGHGLKRSRIEQKFVFDYPESVISAQMLVVYATRWGKETVEELYTRFSSDLKTSENGQKIKKYLDLVQAPGVGSKYVDFSMADTTGQQQKLSNNLGKLTLLDFWASWCGPCLRENPRLVKTYQKYRELGL